MNDNEHLSYLVARTEKAMRNKITILVGRYNLTLSQFGVLRRLFQDDGLTLNDLDHRLFKDRVTIISVIERLKEKGLISDRPDHAFPEEARFYLTVKVLEFIPELIERVNAMEMNYEKALTGEEETVFRKALEKLHEAALTF